MREFLLEDEDEGTVVNAATAGFRAASPEDFPRIILALFRVADKLNCLQEDEVIHLLEEHGAEASHVARQIVGKQSTSVQHVNWLSPKWRILWHLEYVNKNEEQA